MKVEKIKEEKKKGKLTFLLKGSNEAFANTIRRLIIEEVPTLAVEAQEDAYIDNAATDLGSFTNSTAGVSGFAFSAC